MMPLPICPLLDLLLLICTTLEWMLSFRQQEGKRRGWLFPLPMICTTIISESRRILAAATAVLHSTTAVLPCPILIFCGTYALFGVSYCGLYYSTICYYYYFLYCWLLLLAATILYYYTLLLLLYSICYYTLLFDFDSIYVAYICNDELLKQELRQ